MQPSPPALTDFIELRVLQAHARYSGKHLRSLIAVSREELHEAIRDREFSLTDDGLPAREFVAWAERLEKIPTAYGLELIRFFQQQ